MILTKHSSKSFGAGVVLHYLNMYQTSLLRFFCHVFGESCVAAQRAFPITQFTAAPYLMTYRQQEPALTRSQFCHAFAAMCSETNAFVKVLEHVQIPYMSCNL